MMVIGIREQAICSIVKSMWIFSIINCVTCFGKCEFFERETKRDGKSMKSHFFLPSIFCGDATLIFNFFRQLSVLEV